MKFLIRYTTSLFGLLSCLLVLAASEWVWWSWGVGAALVIASFALTRAQGASWGAAELADAQQVAQQAVQAADVAPQQRLCEGLTQQALPIWKKQIENGRHQMEDNIRRLTTQFAVLSERLDSSTEVIGSGLARSDQSNVVALFDKSHSELDHVFKTLMEVVGEQFDTFEHIHKLAKESEALVG